MKYLLLFLLTITSTVAESQMKKKSASPTKSQSIPTAIFDSLKFRNIGPAFMSGRIADLAINPRNENIWYVAVGSGGVWKTINAGTTFKPIFDGQKVYSIGCVALDPNNPDIVWVGTGENVGGRHVGFGDGVYRSLNGGETWENMGLKNSEHLAKIIVHPDNSNVILVASQGPLWKKGGQRGFFKSTDGGKTWNKTLGDDEYTGVTDLVYDPRNPNRLYAVTWEHHRTIAAWMGGGEKSRLYISNDAGDSWDKVPTKGTGLPDGKWGKTGLAVSPINPDILYAAIELNRTKGGIWRSADRGGSWVKMSDAVAGATGPHYYQEIYASPHKLDRLYMMNNSLMKSEDGGKTFSNMDQSTKHGDNHAVAFKHSDPNYLLVGTDGGVYESFDLGLSWRYMENLPVTQFYKVAVDDTKPFYNVFGGTQDNSTPGGPSRTDNHHGIRNSDWKIVLNWDGHQPATEPGNPDIMYAQRQQGTLSRVDMITGEVVDIMPQPATDEPYERYNWDAPILVSPHEPTTIYHASHRLWKSTDRGDSWETLSGDLTKNQERLALPIMGKVQSWDSPWDVGAMSNFNTITSIAVSPKNEKLIIIGTDDGLIQITTDEGNTWKKIDVSALGAPKLSYVNDIKADLFDENILYVALDNHKEGDFQPYLYKSLDKGLTWNKITDGISERNLVWRIVQDHTNPKLLFAGTEFGVYFSIDGGENWTQMTGGLPTIPIRDLAIQRRENDLIAASFGRGFFILDDYSALSSINKSMLDEPALLFTPRKAWWYVERSTVDFDDPRGSQGSQMYLAPNPPFGVQFTYFLKEEIKSSTKKRQDKEKGVKGDIPFPGWKALQAELIEAKPFVFIEITDQEGNVINRVKASNKAGFQRVAWDLRKGGANIIGSENKLEDGLLCAPGNYAATLYKSENDQITQLCPPVEVEVERLRAGAITGRNINNTIAFWRDYEILSRDVHRLGVQMTKSKDRAEILMSAAMKTNVGTEVLENISQIIKNLKVLSAEINGNPAKNEIGEKNNPTIGSRLASLTRGVTRSTYGPTKTHLNTMEMIKEQINPLFEELNKNRVLLDETAAVIMKAGGAWVE